MNYKRLILSIAVISWEVFVLLNIIENQHNMTLVFWLFAPSFPVLVLLASMFIEEWLEWVKT